VADKQPEMPEHRGGGAPAGLEVVAGMLKIAGLLLGRDDTPILTRGFLGVELADDGLAVKTVLAKSPAEDAGMKPGDQITRFQNKDVTRAADLYPLAAKVSDGQTIKLTVRRGADTKEITLKAGKAL
jgi:S1-C subfamily serine protease